MSLISVGGGRGAAEEVMSCLGIEVSEADYTVPWRQAGPRSDGNPAPPNQHTNRYQCRCRRQMHGQVHHITGYRVAESQEDLCQRCDAQARDSKAEPGMQRTGTPERADNDCHHWQSRKHHEGVAIDAIAEVAPWLAGKGDID